MTEVEAKPPIPLEDVTRIVLELSAKPDLGGAVSRFLEVVRGWAAPSAVLAAAEDAGAEAGWRLLPALCVGLGPLGVEKALARMVEEAPACRTRPTVLQPEGEAPGVKVRDNWILPWWHEAEKGVLVLRGVPRAVPANLGDALVAVSAPLWPRIIGSPAERVQSLVRELSSVAARLQDEAARQAERLQVTLPPPVDTGAAEKLEQVEAQLAAARTELEAGLRAHQEAQAKVAALEESLRAAEGERASARGHAEGVTARLQELAAQHAAAGEELQRLREAASAAEAAQQGLDAARQALEAAQQAARQAEAQRDEARGELEQVKAAQAAFVEQLEQARQAVERANAATLSGHEAEAERDAARAEAEKLAGEVEQLKAAQAAFQETIEQARAAVEKANAAAAAAGEAARERDEARAELQKLGERVQQLTAELKVAGEQAEQLRGQAEAGEAAAWHAREAEEDRDQAKAEVERLTAALAEARKAAAESTLAIAPAPAAGPAPEVLQKAEADRDQALRERDEARAEVDRLTTVVEGFVSEQATVATQIAEVRGAAEKSQQALASAKAELIQKDNDLVRKQSQLEQVVAQLEGAKSALAAVTQQQGHGNGSEKATLALRSAVSALRRSTFVSAPLRASLDEAVAALGSEAPAPAAGWLNVAMLDRDPRPEAVVAELEAHGIRVRLANHPEELAILVRTPEGRDLDAVICDVMSFRPNDVVAGIFRAWEKDKPGLLFFLSFTTNDPGEVERAKRVPLSLLAGHVHRPIKIPALLETLNIQARKIGKVPPPRPAAPGA